MPFVVVVRNLMSRPSGRASLTSWKRPLALGLFALAVVTVLAVGPALGQAAKPGSGEKSDAQCYGHHREEGFRSMDLAPENLQSVAAGGPFQFHLTVRNPWLHELHDVFAFVNTSLAPGIQFPGAKDPEPVSDGGTLPLNPQAPASAEVPVEIGPNATLLLVRLTGDKGPLDNGDFDLAVVAPNGDTYTAPADIGLWRPGRTYVDEVLTVPYANITQGGLGAWTVRVVYASGAVPDAAWEIDGAVYYNLSRSTELFVKGPSNLAPGASHTFTFDLIATGAPTVTPEDAIPDEDFDPFQAQVPTGPGGPIPVQMVYGGKAVAYNKHTDPNAEDFGNYTKFSTMSFVIGSQTVVGAAVETAGQDILLTLGPSFRAWGEVVGFAASMVMVPALLLGGVFGRGSIVWMNDAFGGARRRVLFHNAASYGLLIFSLVHMYLLLLEPAFGWNHGLVLGGLALACMVGLALTGAFQRRLVVAWGFPRWRFVHFALGVLMVLFVLAHLVVDGTHFEAVRGMFGKPVVQ